MILDVGCGTKPRGDVNVDLPMGGNYGRSRTGADVIASVYHLPFRSDTFDEVIFYGLLHHLSEPKKGWNEMIRVSRKIVSGVEPGWPVWPESLTGVPLDMTESNHAFSKKSIKEITRGAQVKRVFLRGYLPRIHRLPVFFTRFRIYLVKR
jgi:ubiquinone/menaquinone biosynthesis C-methylase UbiE